MKKLLGTSLLSLVLVACSSSKTVDTTKPMTPEMAKEEFMTVFKSCEAKLGGKVTQKDIPMLDACMAENGFNRVKEEPKVAPKKKLTKKHKA